MHPARHDKTRRTVWIESRDSLAWSEQSAPTDHPRRVAFSEEVLALQSYAAVHSVFTVCVAYNVAAAGRLGVAACVTAAAAVRPPDALPTQTRHRTHRSGGRTDSFHTDTPDTTVVSRLARRCELDIMGAGRLVPLH